MTSNWTLATLGRRPTAAVAACLLAQPLLLAGVPGGEADVLSVLRSKPGDRRTAEQVTGQLRRLGPGSVPALLELCVDGPESLFTPEELATEHLWGADPSALTGLAAEALASMKRKHVLPALRAALEGEPELGRQLAVCRVLVHLGAAEGVELALELAADIGLPRADHPSVRKPLLEAVIAGVNEDPAAISACERLLPKLKPVSKGLLAEALGRSDCPEGVRVLTRMLGEHPELDLLVLKEIPHLYARMPWRVLWEPQSDLRALLEDEHWELRSAALFALTEIHDRESFPLVLDLLDDPHPRVRETARWAVDVFTGTRLVLDREGLEGYYRKRVAWWEENRARLDADLRSSEVARVSAAARELAGCRIFREEAARMLAGVLRSDRPEASIAACAALRRLDSLAPVTALTDLLATAEGPARDAALQTLRALTREDLPEETEVWEDFIYRGLRPAPDAR